MAAGDGANQFSDNTRRVDFHPFGFLRADKGSVSPQFYTLHTGVITGGGMHKQILPNLHLFPVDRVLDQNERPTIEGAGAYLK